MPTGTRVHKMAQAIMRAGGDEGMAIATAQKRTGQSYQTGKPLHKKPQGGQGDVMRTLGLKK